MSKGFFGFFSFEAQFLGKFIIGQHFGFVELVLLYPVIYDRAVKIITLKSIFRC